MRALAILSFVCLTACASGALPPERCTPSYQRAYLAACEIAIEEACEVDAQACFLVGGPACKEALEEFCPSER